MEEKNKIEEKQVVETPQDVEVVDATLGFFEKLMEMSRKYGFVKMFFGVFFFVFFSYMAYIAVNPRVIFERYEKYVAEIHSNSVDFRMESTPIIRAYLNQLVAETGAERAYILEFHNGKSNPTGLQWQFGDLTFINDGTDDISDEIQNVSLARYTFANLVHMHGCWAGRIEELVSIDERFYNRMRLNGGVYYAFQMIYGVDMKEIGILGISFITEESIPDKETALMKVHKYAAAISPYLDEGTIRKK